MFAYYKTYEIFPNNVKYCKKMAEYFQTGFKQFQSYNM